MTDKEKEDVLDWLEEIAKYPENIFTMYSESEIQTLAKDALELLNEAFRAVTLRSGSNFSERSDSYVPTILSVSFYKRQRNQML